MKAKSKTLKTWRKKQTTATTITKEADKFNMRQMHFIK